LVTAAEVLGIPHAPGYPLYVLTAHVFTWLPFGDVAYRVNLFSVLCLTFSVPLMYGALVYLLRDKLIAAGATLTFAWSYYIWTTGIVAEVYAPQLFLLSVCAFILAQMFAESDKSLKGKNKDLKSVLAVGVCFGLAVSFNPSSIFFAPGLATALLLMRVDWRICVLGGVASLLVFGLSLLYFPIRYAAEPDLNAAGEYNADGTFETVDLGTPSGVWWLISGRQFDSFFFVDGYLPSFNQLQDIFSLFWGNFLGFGLFLGIAGGYKLFTVNRGLFAAWLIFFLPYTFFYATYGADDRETMFGPSYLVWTFVLAFGVQWAADEFSGFVRYGIALALPVALLVINFPLVDVSEDTGFRDHAETVMATIPENAAVFGYWGDTVPIQYLHIVEDQRTDITLHNLFFFSYDAAIIHPYVNTLLEEGRPVVFLDTAAINLLSGGNYKFMVLGVDPEDQTPLSMLVENFET
jgi:hypothetical protein